MRITAALTSYVIYCLFHSGVTWAVKCSENFIVLYNIALSIIHLKISYMLIAETAQNEIAEHTLGE